MKKSLFICMVLFIAFSFVGLARTSAVSIAEKWQGVWSSDRTWAKGKFQLTVRQEDTTLYGNIVITGSMITRGGEISGTINGNSIEFGLVKDKRGALKYTGTISEDRISGTWKIITIISDEGIWKASEGHTEDFL